MQDSHSDRGLLYPSDLDICHRVYEQVRHQRGFDFNSPAAETLASYVLFSYQNGTTDEAELLTAARRKLIAIDTDDGPYDVDVFAKKHRMTCKPTLRSKAATPEYFKSRRAASSGSTRRCC